MMLLDEILPKISIKDQVPLGMGWSEARQSYRDAKCAAWDALDLSTWLAETGADRESGTDQTSCKVLDSRATDDTDDEEEEEEEEGELEEWEIEAEKHFQESEDVAPAPAPAKPVSKPKNATEPLKSRHNINLIMEQAVIQPLTFEEEQVRFDKFYCEKTTQI